MPLPQPVALYLWVASVGAYTVLWHMHDPNGRRVTSHEEFWVLSCRILGVQGPASPRHEPHFVLPCLGFSKVEGKVSVWHSLRRLDMFKHVCVSICLFKQLGVYTSLNDFSFGARLFNHSDVSEVGG